MREIHAVFLIALSSAFYGCLGFLGLRLMEAGFSMSHLLFWRFFVASGLLLLVHKSARTAPAFREDSSIGFRNSPFTYLIDGIVGVLFYSGSSALYFFSAEQIGTGLSMVIFFCYPVFVILLETLWIRLVPSSSLHSLGIRAPALLFSIFLILLGSFLLNGNWREKAVHWNGIFLALASALFYAIYLLRSKKQMEYVSSIDATALLCMSNTVFFLFLSIWDGTLKFPQTPLQIGYILAMGTLATGIPILLLLMGLKYVSAAQASLLSVLEPVVTVLIGYAFLHENLQWTQVLGMGIVVLGALWVQFPSPLSRCTDSLIPS